VAAAALWYAGGTLRIAPHYLAYFNEAAGGPVGGSRVLIDSNLDWGQDDGLLAEFVCSNPDTVFVNPGPSSPTVGTVAVNVNSLRGIFRGDDAAYRWLRPFKPERTLGYTWYIYRLDVEDFAAHAERTPGDPGPKFWLATVLRKEGRLDDALSVLREISTEFSERSRAAWTLACDWLLQSGRPDEAEEALSRARRAGGAGSDEKIRELEAAVRWRAGTASSEDLRRLARRYAQTGRAAEARAVLEWALKAYPRDAELALTMAIVEARAGRFAEAEAYSERALELDPELQGARRALAAARELERAKRSPEDYESHMILAQHYHKYGDPLEAARHYWEAFNLAPDSQAVLAAMGEIVVRSKLGLIRRRPPCD
jgi:tetratricopeptide (TPR) repeat protein